MLYMRHGARQCTVKTETRGPSLSSEERTDHEVRVRDTNTRWSQQRRHWWSAALGSLEGWARAFWGGKLREDSGRGWPFGNAVDEGWASGPEGRGREEETARLGADKWGRRGLGGGVGTGELVALVWTAGRSVGCQNWEERKEKPQANIQGG